MQFDVEREVAALERMSPAEIDLAVQLCKHFELQLGTLVGTHWSGFSSHCHVVEGVSEGTQSFPKC
jgi:hypothetical protein